MFFYKKIDSIKCKKFNLRGTKFNDKRLSFGLYGLKSLETGRLSENNIDTCVAAMRRKLKPLGGQLWVRLNPSISVTKKASSVRMGKGKGPIDRHIAFVRKGQILFEITVLNTATAVGILELGASKIPMRTRFISY
jgi:large subunit ribosomal protein L16|tara:strand:- start:412 stop:819 length:408 start_codon:yes stop_codon:yes gene_type:complete